MKAVGKKGSVRAGLLLWISGIVAICLLGFCGLFRAILKVRLLALVDSQLTDRSVALVKLWNSIPLVARDAVREELGSGQIGSRLFVQDEDAVHNTPVPRPDESLTGIYRPRAFAPDGSSYLKGLNDTQLDHSAISRAFKGETVHSTVFIGSMQLRVITVPVQSEDEVPFVLQSARDLRDYNAEISEVTRDLLRCIPVLLIVSVAAGYLLTARAMRPVRDIREAADRISGENLSERLPVTSNDEFSELAETLNSMFARVDQAFRQQAQFTADASHELRTPITVLRGNTSLALATERTAEEYRATIEKTQRTAESMSRLVDQLLLLARADADQKLFEPEEIELTEIIEAALESFVPEESSRFRVEINGTLPATGSYSLMQRVFENLFANSLNYSQPGTPITVVGTKDTANDQLQIEVSDKGPGIPAEDLERVRERFFRSDVARSRHAGSGLGLAICDSIVKAHGGTLTIRSIVNSGATVVIVLPCKTGA
jgi:heavy metal sensor kinase